MGIHEIEARLSAISQELETRAADLTQEQLDKFETEVNTLKAKRDRLRQGEERRTTLLSSIAEGREGGATVTRSFPSPAAASNEQRTDETDKFGTPEYRRAFMNHVVRGAAIPVEYRADAITKTTDVGAVIPTTTLNKIVEKMESVGMILPLVTRTAYKGGVNIPTSSVKPVATWVAEGMGSDKQKKTTGGSITFAYHKLRCSVAVSLETDTMALSAFESTLMNNVVEAMTKALEQSIISGTGTGQPKGILTEEAAPGQALESAAPSYTDLLAAEGAIPQAYENGAVWCMSKKTFMQYFGLLDTNGQPIGRVNHGITGRPERFLLGRPVLACDYVDSFSETLEAGKPFAFLFNFTDYVLNTNYTMGIKKYEDNETDDLVTKAVMLVDGRVVQNGSLVVIKKKA